MLCSVLKRPDEVAEPVLEVQIVKEGDRLYGKVAWPKGEIPRPLQRLLDGYWTRNHSYGYIRTPEGKLYKIEGYGAEGASDPERITSLTLVPAFEKFKISAYCKCGGAMLGSARTRDMKAAENCVKVFWEAHSKPGCGETDQKTAARARRRGEAKATE
jgi:hypothetical protein